MKKLLLGTTNNTKIDEYKKLLAALPMEVVSLTDLGIKERADEMNKTLEENAISKAKFYFEKSGIPTLVDEGGLEIPALTSSKSQTWIGKELSHDELVKEIMKRMEGQTERGCRLNCVLALATPFGVMTSDSSVEGIIADSASSKKIEGHPYRSLMYFPNYNKYFCDLTESETEILNHRKHAFEKIKDMFVEIAK